MRVNFILGEDAWTDWNFGKSFSVKKERFSFFRTELVLFWLDVWVTCNEKSNWAQVVTIVLLLPIKATWRSCEYSAIGDKNLILTIFEIRKYVYQFCSYIKMKYGLLFSESETNSAGSNWYFTTFLVEWFSRLFLVSLLSWKYERKGIFYVMLMLMW